MGIDLFFKILLFYKNLICTKILNNLNIVGRVKTFVKNALVVL